MNKLYFGDNLEILREMEDERVDLICTDPPFNSGRDYNVFLGDSLAQDKAFTDTWKWDRSAEETRENIERRARDNDTYKVLDDCLKAYDLMLQYPVSGDKGAMRAYLAFMGPRLAEMHRILTKKGNIYLHCDPTACHYLKCVMDTIFGTKNFRNQIAWQRTKSHKDGNQYGRIHDTILFYSKSRQSVWNPVYTALKPEYVKGSYSYNDEIGIYRLQELTGQGIRHGESGQPWRGVNPSNRPSPRHWAVPGRKSWPEQIQPPDNFESLSVHEKLDVLDTKGLIHWPSRGKIPRFKKYLSTSKGSKVKDLIADISLTYEEDLDYPTQKPIELYERFIKASSNEDSLILDPFCGCGTTIDAAHTLKRRWIGIDLTILALDPMRQRLEDRHGLKPSIDYEIEGYPTNMQEVRKLVRNEKKYHDFSNWAVTRLGLQPTKDVGDGGRDGVGHFKVWTPMGMEETQARILAEVKSGKPTVAHVRAFRTTMQDNNAEVGIFITIEPISAGMKRQAEAEGRFEHNNQTYPRLQFWQIDDTYFENPDIISTILRLPDQWIIRPTRKSERHFAEEQIEIGI